MRQNAKKCYVALFLCVSCPLLYACGSSSNGDQGQQVSGQQSTILTLPTLPQAQVSTTRPRPSIGTSCAGSNLATVQACINAAAALTGASGNLNHEVIITAGFSFTGPLNLATRGVGSTGWIIIRSSGSGSLPEGTRVSPASASNMAKIIVDGVFAERAIQASDNAHHYWMIGLEVAADTSGGNQNIVDTGGDDKEANRTTTHHFMIDRCYIHGDSTVSVVRGVALNAYQGYTGVIDSYIDEIHAHVDAQAVWAFQNPGPILIQNNYLAASGENIMFGGVSTLDPSVQPADITIVRNEIMKPVAWNTIPPVSSWQIKTLIELKTALRVLIEGNRISESWNTCIACAEGYSMRLTVRNENGLTPFAEVSDVTIRYNKFWNVVSMFNLTGSDGVNPSGKSRRYNIHDNLWYNLTGPDMVWGVGNNGGGSDITISHNTVVGSDTGGTHITFVQQSALAWARFAGQNNIISFHDGGLTDDRSPNTNNGSGTDALNFVFGATWTWDYNAVVRAGGDPRNHPAGNFWPVSYTAVGFVDEAANDYHLAPGSPYKNAGSNGKDLGADITALELAMQ